MHKATLQPSMEHQSSRCSPLRPKSEQVIQNLRADGKELTPDLPGFMQRPSSRAARRTVLPSDMPLRDNDEADRHPFLQETFYIPGITGKPRCLLDSKRRDTGIPRDSTTSNRSSPPKRERARVPFGAESLSVNSYRTRSPTRSPKRERARVLSVNSYRTSSSPRPPRRSAKSI